MRPKNKEINGQNAGPANQKTHAHVLTWILLNPQVSLSLHEI